MGRLYLHLVHLDGGVSNLVCGRVKQRVPLAAAPVRRWIKEKKNPEGCASEVIVQVQSLLLTNSAALERS